MDFLQQLDTEALVAINQAYCPYLDRLMTLVAGKFTWALMLLALVWINARKGWRQTLVVIVAMAITILIADRVASGLIKPWVMRLRPTHDPALGDAIHVIDGYRGGMYGFVSSHASNTLAVALLVMLWLKNRWATIALTAWVALVCYCRMYQGVHYPGDIVGGALVGTAAALAVFAAWRGLSRRHAALDVSFTANDGKALSIAIFANILILCLLAIIPI